MCRRGRLTAECHKFLNRHFSNHPNREPRPTMLALVSRYVSEKYYYSTKIGVKISPDVSRTFCLAFVRFLSTADHYQAGLNTCFLFASLRILC